MTHVYGGCLFVLLLVAWPAAAALGTLDGEDPRTWTEDGVSVVVGTVRNVRAVKDGAFGQYRATFLPVMTVAGTFDGSVRTSVDVRLHAGGLNSSVRRPPADGDLVIAVLLIGRHYADEPEASNWITADKCSFMPDDSALVVLKDAADPRVVETLKRIQVARAPRKATDRPGHGAAADPPAGPKK